MDNQTTRELFTSQEHKMARVQAQEQLKIDRTKQLQGEKRETFKCNVYIKYFDNPINHQLHILKNHDITDDTTDDRRHKHKKECCLVYKKHLQCQYCNHEASNLKNLDKHVLLCKSNENRCFRCSVCRKKFMNNEKLQAHMAKCSTKGKLLSCPKWQKLVAEYNLSNHIPSYNGQPSCTVTSESQESSQSSQKSNKLTIVNCPNCNKQLASYNLNNHLPSCKGKCSSTSESQSSSHASEKQDKVQFVNCPICNKQLAAYNLNNHLPSCHPRPLPTTASSNEHTDKIKHTEHVKEKCHDCDKTFNSTRNFHLHKCTVELFCQICKRQFNSRIELKNHRRTCCTIYSCSVCQKNFAWKDTCKKT